VGVNKTYRFTDVSELIDNSWIRWAFGGISAIGSAVALHFHVRQTAHEQRLEDMRQKISDSHDNAVRDIWQALEADRKASQKYREVVLTGLAKAATKDDLAGLGREIAAQFQRRKDA
jgi:hypothetical protein